MKEINNFQEFHAAISSCGKLSTFNQQLSNFLNIVSGLSGGCGCSKKQRVDAARNFYLQMPTILSQEEKLEIKSKLGVDKIQLSDGGGVFSIF